jgi:adenine/guanine phosphoribosyltransferase-like PRPP-binding protein
MTVARDAASPCGAVPSLEAPTTMRIVGRDRAQLATPLDGRYGPMDPADMKRAIEHLAGLVDLAGIDYVLGIPEGGSAPAYAFAAATGLRVIFASIWRPNAESVVTFREVHDTPPFDAKHIYGLAAGDRVLLVEDEVTTGGTAINCVRALRAAGIHCDQIATIFAADGDALQGRLAAERLLLTAVMRFPAVIGERLYR